MLATGRSGEARRIALKLRARRRRAQGGWTADRARRRGNSTLRYLCAPASFKPSL